MFLKLRGLSQCESWKRPRNVSRGGYWENFPDMGRRYRGAILGHLRAVERTPRKSLVHFDCRKRVRRKKLKVDGEADLEPARSVSLDGTAAAQHAPRSCIGRIEARIGRLHVVQHVREVEVH